MADKKIIDLPALTVQSLTDLKETSANGGGSFKETRAQELSYMRANIAGAPYLIGQLIVTQSPTTLGRLGTASTGNALLAQGVGLAPAWGPVNLTTTVSGILPLINGGTNSDGSSFYVSSGRKGLVYSNGTQLISGSDFTYDATQGISQIASTSPNPGMAVQSLISGLSNVAYTSVSRGDILNGSAQYRWLTVLNNEWTFGTQPNTQNLILTSHNGANTVATFNYTNSSVTINSGNLNIANLTPSSVVLTDGSDNLVSMTAGVSGQVLTSSGSGVSPTWETPAGGDTAYGYMAVQNLSTVISYSDFTTWKALPGTILSSSVNNFIVANNTSGDPTTPYYMQYMGADTSVFQITASMAMRRFSSTTTDAYYISLSLDGVNPISSTFGDRQLPYFLSGVGTQASFIISYTVQLTLSTNQKIYFIVRNDTNISSTDNDFLNSQAIICVQKVMSVGGSSAGVASLNGLTTNLNLLSNNSVSISPSGDNITIEVCQYNVISGTSQTLIPNMCYLCTNAGLTTLLLPTTCPVGSYMRIAGVGSGLFQINQNSGQSISMGPETTTTGTSGNLVVISGENNSALELVCTVANTSFMVVSAQGSFTLN